MAALREMRHKYESAFKKADKDSSGQIDFDELMGLMDSLGKNTDPTVVKKIFDQTDKDNSGQIDLKEFMVLMENIDNAWIRVQKKTFTRWSNTVLSERMLKVEDLTEDYRDGVNLINLVEILSEKKVGRYNKKPKMKVVRCENLGTVLRFLKGENVSLVNIGPDDIEAGSLKITLGLVWTLILHYQIGNECAEGSPKWALLQWVKEQVKPYGLGEDLKNFKKGWSDGLVLTALCDSVGPGMHQTIDTRELPDDPYKKTQLCLDVAERDFEIPPVVDAEDVVEEPEEHSIMTYVSYFRDYLENHAKKEEEKKRKTADPQFCRAYGPGLEGGRTNQNNMFTIETRNCYDQVLAVSDPTADIQASVTPPEGVDATIECAVVDSGTGTYPAQYTVKLPGTYTVTVTCKGQPISGGGVFAVTISGPTAAACSVAGPGVEGGEAVDGSTHFTITASADGTPITNGGDTFQAVVAGPTGEALACNLTDNGDGTYTGNYPVATSGDYTVQVSLYGDAVGQSPYTARMGADAAQCVAFGPGLEGGFNNKEATFTIEARDTHGNKLAKPDGSQFTVASTGPAEVDVSVADNGDGTYTCTYTPPVPGTYDLTISCNGVPIADGVRQVLIEGPAAGCCRAEGPGVEGGDARAEQAIFTVLSFDAGNNRVEHGGDPFVAKVTGPDGVEVAGVSIADNGDGTYGGAYAIGSPGNYLVEISLLGEAIGGSPYTAHMEAGNAGNSYAEGPGLSKGKTGRTLPFTIFSVDANGERVACGGDPFVVSVVHSSGEQMPHELVDNGDGTYSCSYTPTVEGAYAIDVTLFDQPIKDAPFEAQIKRAPDASKSSAQGKGLKKAYDNKPAHFTVTAKGADGEPVWGDSCEVTVSGPEEAKVEVIDLENGTYEVTYYATVAGVYSVDAKLDGDSVQNVPVEVKCIEGADVSKMGKGSFKFTIQAVNKQGEVKTEGGDEFEVVVVGPNEFQVPTKLSDNGDGSYSATYTLNAPRGDGDDPVAAQEYAVSVQLNGDHVPGSPFTQFM